MYTESPLSTLTSYTEEEICENWKPNMSQEQFGQKELLYLQVCTAPPPHMIIRPSSWHCTTTHATTYKQRGLKRQQHKERGKEECANYLLPPWSPTSKVMRSDCHNYLAILKDLQNWNQVKVEKESQPRVQHTCEKVSNIKLNAYICKYISSKTCELVKTFPKIKDPMKCKKQHWLAAPGNNSYV